MLFAVGTGPVPSGGNCGPTAAIKSLPADGALFAVIEYGGPVGKPYTFPPRPKHLELGPLLGPECWRVKDHLISFEDGGGFFQIQVVFGKDAPPSLREMVTPVTRQAGGRPLPPRVRRAAECRAGHWTPAHRRPGSTR